MATHLSTSHSTPPHGICRCLPCPPSGPAPCTLHPSASPVAASYLPPTHAVPIHSPLPPSCAPTLCTAAMHAQRSSVLHTHSTTCPWPFFFSTPRQTLCPVRPRIRFCTECLGLPPPLHPALPPHPASHLVVAAAAGNSRFEALHHPHFVSLAHTFPARPTRPPGFPSQGGQRGSTATSPCSCNIALSY